jgi:Ca2+-binding EF-hand superfamily protein
MTGSRGAATPAWAGFSIPRRTAGAAVAAALLCALGAAQVIPPTRAPSDTAAGETPQTGTGGWTPLPRHSEKTSRAAFRACDTSADDQISILEAMRTIRGLGDAELFRRLDLDSDGYLQWPEFDRYFRDTVARGLTVQIRPQRPLPAGIADEESGDPMQDNAKRMHTLLDKNGDGTVAVDEALQVVKASNMPASIVQIVAGLDADQSGDISEAELLTVARMFPAAPSAPTGAGKSKRSPAAATGLRSADTDRDGIIDEKELGAAIGRLDPALSRWAAQIITDADDSGNGSIGPLELRHVQRSTGKPGAAQKPGKTGDAATPSSRPTRPLDSRTQR